jgi:phosphatidylserine/phosphatidylglycerophosphate/cardiolipin synthase-like enzyme
MRFKSGKVGGVQVFAVAGTNTVSFGLDVDAGARPGLLGFAVERIDPAKGERYYLHGFKVFPSIIPHPDQDTFVSTFGHPIQSLVWDDFSAEPGHGYGYVFHPLAGTPKNIDRSRPAVQLDVYTEPLFGESHDVFFNRGVASSQAYARRFKNVAPDHIATAAERKRALDWLSRDLDDALVKFIRAARPGDALRGSFYEFSYPPVLVELEDALGRGVDVQLVIDCKVNEHTVMEKQRDGTSKPRLVASSPRLVNLAAVKEAGLPATAVIPREARRAAIAHNKFLVRLSGRRKVPTQVWTGSTNLTDGGIHGQANVGHWIRDSQTAEAFHEYWKILAGDPGGRPGDSNLSTRAKNSALYKAVAALTPAPATSRDVPPGVTPIFSPRSGDVPLDLYADLLTSAARLGCITFAFTVPDRFKAGLKTHTSDSAVSFLLLEKGDRPTANSPKPFVKLNASNNVYMASGSELGTPLGQWVAEVTTRQLGLNVHVAFIHCKFLLRDPLGDDPIVVTGSANFSDASTNDNDENMVVIRGDKRVADIYFTEFNRLFNHYYFRSITHRTRATETLRALQLVENDSWLDKYKTGTLRSKRAACLTSMSI